MGTEEVEIDGQLITVRLPVGNIEIQDKQVTYSDATGLSTCEFSTAQIARQFADWLQAQAV